MSLSNVIKYLTLSSTLLMSLNVVADDEKTFIGSSCSFADNPLHAHSKMHHRFKNTSNRGQWTTCPIVRDSVKSRMEWVGLDTYGTVSNVRLEQRRQQNGSLSGWNAYGSTNLSGSGKQHYWFNGSAKGVVANRASLAIELYMSHNAYVNMYRTSEN